MAGLLEHEQKLNELAVEPIVEARPHASDSQTARQHYRRTGLRETVFYEYSLGKIMPETELGPGDTSSDKTIPPHTTVLVHYAIT